MRNKPEGGNRPATVKERVERELEELIGKYERLGTFIKEDSRYKELSLAEQQLLQRQYLVMEEYRHVLVLRLHYWK